MHKQNKLIEKLINNGKGCIPVELTSSDPETMKALEIIEKGVYTTNTGEEYDFGTSLFWDISHSVAVIVYN